MELKVEPLGAPMGAVIRGWNPGEELSEGERVTIVDALRRHLVLVFRGQRFVTDRELIRFAATFGELIKGSAWLERTREHAEILQVGNLTDEDGKPEGVGGTSRLAWHADYDYCKKVGRESFLNAVELPTRKSPRTYFSNQYAAFETLPAQMQARLRTLEVFHSISAGYKDPAYEGAERYAINRQHDRDHGIEPKEIPEATHRMVVRHPQTDREILYIGERTNCTIMDLQRDEGEALLADLCAHSTRDANVYAHDWEVGDLVMFDTLGTLHSRDAWDTGERRSMRQLTTLCEID